MSVTFFGSQTIFSRQFETINLSLLPRSDRIFTFELFCKYSGNYDIGVERIEIEDFLGIFKFVYKVPFPISLTVYPRVIILERFRLKTDFTSESFSALQNKFEDIGALQDVRKYVYGDNLKKVHWKLTAKLNEIMIKRFQSTTESSAIIIPDLKRNNFTIEQNTIVQDKIIESTISVVHYCLHKWMPVNLVCYSNEVRDITASNPLHFQDIYSYISEIHFSNAINLSNISHIYIKDKTIKTNLILCTANLDYDLYNHIYYAALSGFNVIVIYISSEELTGSRNDMAESIISDIPGIGANIYKININDEIKTVLEV